MNLSRVFLSALLVSLVTVVTACPGPEYPECKSDDQCKKDKEGQSIDEYCLLGKCQECAKDSHCGTGESCNRGRCEQTCASDDQCGDGSICESRRCVTAQCTDDSTCGTGASCEKGRCKRADAAATNTGTGGDDGLNCQTSGTVGFDFNVSDLRADARSALDTMAKCMQKNTTWKLTVAGHADERGTPEFNLSLGESRAKSIRKYITALGVDQKRIKIVSYGEEKPINNSSTEEAWAQNRRGELSVAQ